MMILKMQKIVDRELRVGLDPKFKREAGFTLLEVIITLTILSGMVFAASTLMRASFDMRSALSQQNKVTQRLNTTLQRLNYDLTHIFVLDDKMPGRNDGLRRRTVFKVVESAGSQKIAFTYMGHEATRANSKESSLSYVVYEVRPSDKYPGRGHLFRGEFPRVPENFKTDIKFDVILNMEIIEHVEDVNYFINKSSQFLKKNGLMYVATLNKTLKSYLFAIIGAEYILRWLPIGTHEWDKFIEPSKLIQYGKQNSLKLERLDGMVFNPIMDKWNISNDNSVNYIIQFKKI